MDAADQFGPGLGGSEAANCAVEGDDVCSGVADGLGGAEVWGDVDVAVGVAGLDDADDRELRDGPKGGDAFDAFSAEAACAAAQDRGCDAGECVEIVQRVAFGGLTGDDETSAQGFEWRVSGGVRALRHGETSLRAAVRLLVIAVRLATAYLLVCDSRYCGCDERGEEIETGQQTRIYFWFGGAFGDGAGWLRVGKGLWCGAAAAGWDTEPRDQQGYLFVLLRSGYGGVGSARIGG